MLCCPRNGLRSEVPTTPKPRGVRDSEVRRINDHIREKMATAKSADGPASGEPESFTSRYKDGSRKRFRGTSSVNRSGQAQAHNLDVDAINAKLAAKRAEAAAKKAARERLSEQRKKEHESRPSDRSSASLWPNLRATLTTASRGSTVNRKTGRRASFLHSGLLPSSLASRLTRATTRTTRSWPEGQEDLSVGVVPEALGLRYGDDEDGRAAQSWNRASSGVANRASSIHNRNSMATLVKDVSSRARILRSSLRGGRASAMQADMAVQLDTLASSTTPAPTTLEMRDALPLSVKLPPPMASSKPSTEQQSEPWSSENELEV